MAQYAIMWPYSRLRVDKVHSESHDDEFLGKKTPVRRIEICHLVLESSQSRLTGG